jgi:hypothetical protein
LPEQAAIDFRAHFTRTRYASFQRLFKRNPHSPFERCIARLAVLYEDLRIKVFGAKADAGTMPQLDAFGPEYRKLYFMRRAIATAVEFQQAVEQIATCKEFREIEERALNQKDPYYPTEWLPGLQFFRSNRKLLRTVRNDVGGHFGEQATIHALSIISDDYVVRMEVQYDGENNCQVLLPFANELAAAALLKNIPGATQEEKAKAVADLLIETVKHAIEIVQFLVPACLWDRMA